MNNNDLTGSITPPLRIPPSHAGEQSLAEKAKESYREFIEWLTEAYAKGPCIIGNQVIYADIQSGKLVQCSDVPAKPIRLTKPDAPLIKWEWRNKLTKETP